MDIDFAPASPLLYPSEETMEINGNVFKLQALPRKANSLFEAAARGRVEDIQAYISAGCNNLNILDENGVGVLHHAARSNQVQVINLMASAGANIDIQSKDGFSPLHVAARSGALDAVEALLKVGANPTGVAKCSGCTPLHIAVRFGHRKIIHRLLRENTKNIDATDGRGMSALQLAICRGYDDVFRDLLDNNASVSTLTTAGQTTLHLAVVNGKSNIVSQVLDTALKRSANYPVKILATPELPRLKQFVNKKDTDCNSALHMAAQTGNATLCQILVENGAELNIPNKRLQTPLHVASISKNKDVLEFLISQGAEVDVKDCHQKTPLHTAAAFGNKECVRLLLTSGAAVDPRDANSLTPFLCAVAAEKTDCVKMLLNNGADIAVRDKLQRCCVHLAVERKNEELLTILLEKSGSKFINFPDIHERTPLHYAAISSNTRVLNVLLDKKANSMLKDDLGKTPLHLAAEKGETRLVQALAKASPTGIGAKDRHGRTPLHYAALNRRRTVCASLLQMGADVETGDTHGWTPLFFAAKSGAIDIIQMFVGFNADIDHVDIDGNTAVLIASSIGRVGVVQLLLDRRASLVANYNGFNCLDVAIDQQHENAVITLVKNPRWKEILSAKSPDGQNRLGKLIQRFPDAAEVVMDSCIQKSLLQSSITYDFHLIDPGPDDQSGPNGEPFFALAAMVKHKKKDLLTHALSRKLLKVKWRTYGWFIYWTNLLLYALFLCFMTAFMLTRRKSITLEDLSPQNIPAKGEKFEITRPINVVIPYLILLFASVHLIKEVYQIFQQRKSYFKQWTNLLEWALYLSTIFFILPYVSRSLTVFVEDPNISWQIGTVAIFLGYMDLILFVQTLEHVGIYVTMFLQVTMTILKAFSLFAMFALAFSVVFFILFKEQDAFRTFLMTIVKVIIMTVGEIDYATMLVDNLDARNEKTNGPMVPYQETSFIFICIFQFAMPIILMNLLVGLAVGDIESIQKQAFLRHKERVVNFVSSVEKQFPKCITRRLYKPQLVVSGKRALKKFSGETPSLNDEGLSSEEQKKIESGDELNLDALNKELLKAKHRQASIMECVQEQRKILLRVASKVGIDVSNEQTS